MREGESLKERYREKEQKRGVEREGENWSGGDRWSITESGKRVNERGRVRSGERKSRKVGDKESARKRQGE